MDLASIPCYRMMMMYRRETFFSFWIRYNAQWWSRRSNYFSSFVFHSVHNRWFSSYWTLRKHCEVRIELNTGQNQDTHVCSSINIIESKINILFDVIRWEGIVTIDHIHSNWNFVDHLKRILRLCRTSCTWKWRNIENYHSDSVLINLSWSGWILFSYRAFVQTTECRSIQMYFECIDWPSLNFIKFLFNTYFLVFTIAWTHSCPLLSFFSLQIHFRLQHSS